MFDWLGCSSGISRINMADTGLLASPQSGIAADLQQAASALEADLEAESRAARRHRRAASVSGSTVSTPTQMKPSCRRLCSGCKP